MARFEREPKEFVEKVVSREPRLQDREGRPCPKFSALVVVGDEKGKVGFDLGKAAEVAEAIRKGIEDAKKHMVTVTLSGTTIPTRLSARSAPVACCSGLASEGRRASSPAARCVRSWSAPVSRTSGRCCLRSNNPRTWCPPPCRVSAPCALLKKWPHPRQERGRTIG